MKKKQVRTQKKMSLTLREAQAVHDAENILQQLQKDPELFEEMNAHNVKIIRAKYLALKTQDPTDFSEAILPLLEGIFTCNKKQRTV